jgi:hypothetical protein
LVNIHLAALQGAPAAAQASTEGDAVTSLQSPIARIQAQAED